MLPINNFEHIYIYRPFVDFRRGIYGLCSIVQEEMNLNPFDRYLFVFSNKAQNKIKALYWDDSGFAMWYKCLEQEKYQWPSHLSQEYFDIDIKKWNQFLVGLNPWQIPHKKLNYQMS